MRIVKSFLYFILIRSGLHKNNVIEEKLRYYLLTVDLIED